MSFASPPSLPVALGSTGNATADAGADSGVLQDTLRWLERAVIGLNLCPFAKGVHAKGQIHAVVSGATDAEQLLDALAHELQALVAASPEARDTTLLIAPGFLPDFLDFNAFLPRADKLLRTLKLQGEVQIASFHPQFQFAGTEADDVTNCTNRAPYPTLHLLREASIDRAVESYPDVDAIPEHNIERLEAMGRAGWEQLGIQTRVSGEEWVRRCPAGGRKPQPGDGGERDEAGDGDGGE